MAFRGERRLSLSPKEFGLLECLLAAQGRVISAEELLTRVWDEAANPFTSTVKTTIGRLRAKLGEPPVIETVREGGYRIDVESDASPGTPPLVTVSAGLPAPRRWLRLSPRTARLRLTLLYAGSFLVLGTAVIAITYLLASGGPTVDVSAAGPVADVHPPRQRRRIGAGERDEPGTDQDGTDAGRARRPAASRC